jgi:uncharacterized protein (DUF952 family)
VSQPLFHIVDAQVWASAVEAGEYEADSLATEGFMHCSFGHQVHATLGRHYPDVSGLVVVELDAARIPVPVVLENGHGAEDFPHVYGAVPTDAAVGVREVSEFRPGSDAASPDR